jgi:hypothetical protein
MIVGPDQIAALEHEARAKFEAKALAHLRGPLAELTAGQTDEALLAKIRSSVLRARRYGLTSEQEAIAFLDASLFLGDEAFDANPAHSWAAELLADKRYTPREKAALLLDRAFDIHAGRPRQS